MSALSISTIAATEGGAKAAAPAEPGSVGGDGSPFAILLAAIALADPDASVQQASAPQPPSTSGAKQAAPPANAKDPAIAAQIQAGNAAPNSAIIAAGPLSDTPSGSSANTAGNIKADGKSGKKNAGDKDDDKAVADPAQTPAPSPSFLPAPIVPTQTVQVQTAANDNKSDAVDGVTPEPASAEGATPASLLPGANPGSTNSAQLDIAAAGAQPQAIASAPVPSSADGDDETAGASENAAAAQSFHLSQLAAEKFPVTSPANGKTPARPPLPPQAAQTAVDARDASTDAFTDTHVTPTSGTALPSGAVPTASEAAPAPSTSANGETGTSVPRPTTGQNDPALPAPQNPIAADVSSASQDFSPAQPAAGEKTDSKPSRIEAADPNLQPQPAQSPSPTHAASSPVPQTITVTLGGLTPQNGGPGGQATLPNHIAAHDPDAVAGAAVAAPNTDALAVSIAARSLGGSKQFDIRLDPPELGRVEVRLSIDASGKTEAHMTTDQPQTLALLQKDAPILTRALRDAGLDVSQNGLNFSLKGQGQNPGGQGGNFGAPSRGLSLPALAQSIEAVQAGIALPSLSGGARLDIHV